MRSGFHPLRPIRVVRSGDVAARANAGRAAAHNRNNNARLPQAGD